MQIRKLLFDKPARRTFHAPLVAVALSLLFALSAFSPLAQAATATRLTVFGDTGTSSATQSNINLAINEGSQGYLGLGDYEYTASPSQWLNMFQPLTSRGHWMALGNHDNWGSGLTGMFPNGVQWTAAIGGARVVSINTEDRIDVGSAQYNTVRNELCNAQESVRIVTMHKPWWLLQGATHPYTEFPGSPSAMDQMMVDCKVSLVLSGHEHNYQRILRNGINYAVVGTGGESQYVVAGSPSGTQASCQCYGHVVLDLSSTGYSAYFEDIGGNHKDAFSYASPAPAPSPTPAPTPAPTPTPTPVPSTTPSISVIATLDAPSFAQSGTMSGKVTITSTTSVTLPKVVLAARPPGGTNAGGPYLDIGTKTSVLVAAGVPLTLSFSRAVTTSDPIGSWYAFPTYQSSDGAWHDGASVSFSVTSATSTTPTPTPTPTTSGFSATFSGVTGNNYWVQTSVSSSSTIASVCASVNGGSCHALTHQSYGWASSFYVPTGSIVQFTATSSTGATAKSGSYSWPSATLTTAPAPSTSPTPTTTSSATFKPYGGNAWWVQTTVTSSTGVSSVCASLNGGACQALTHESWGAWAASLYAPSGTQVVFQAKLADGSVAKSATYTWPVV